MSLTVSEADTGATYRPCPAGTWPARCVQLVDLGTQQSTFEGQTRTARKVLVGFEVCDPEARRDDGAPFVVSKRFTLSLHEKSALRAFLQSWRGKPFTPEELRGFDLTTLLGVPCLLGVVNVEKDGRTYANISSCMRVPKNMPAPAGELEPAHFDLSNPNWVQFELLPDRIRQQIEASPEFAQAAAGRPQRVVVPAAPTDSPARAVRAMAQALAPTRAPAATPGAEFGDMEDDLPF